MQNAPISTTELNCQHCGWPLIKNGKLKCHRCKQEVVSTLGKKAIFCSYCQNPRILLAKYDSALCHQCHKETSIIEKEIDMEEKGTGQILVQANIFRLISRALKEEAISLEDLAGFLPYELLNPLPIFGITPEEVRDIQVNRLIKLGYPKKSVSNIDIPNSVNCLLIIPSAVVSAKEQMNILGMNRDDDHGCSDYRRTPDVPYWIYDLQWELFDKSFTFGTMRDSLKQRGQRGLTFVEGINLYAQHPMFFLKQDDSVALVGSHVNDSSIPSISVWLYDDRSFVISPNCYGGDKGNNDIIVSCKYN